MKLSDIEIINYLPLKDGIRFRLINDDVIPVDDSKPTHNKKYNVNVMTDDGCQYLFTISQTKGRKKLFNLVIASSKIGFPYIKLVVKKVGNKDGCYNNYDDSFIDNQQQINKENENDKPTSNSNSEDNNKIGIATEEPSISNGLESEEQQIKGEHRCDTIANKHSKRSDTTSTILTSEKSIKETLLQLKKEYTDKYRRDAVVSDQLLTYLDKQPLETYSSEDSLFIINDLFKWNVKESYTLQVLSRLPLPEKNEVANEQPKDTYDYDELMKRGRLCIVAGNKINKCLSLEEIKLIDRNYQQLHKKYKHNNDKEVIIACQRFLKNPTDNEIEDTIDFTA